MADKKSRPRSRAKQEVHEPGKRESILPFPQVTGYWVNRLGGAFRTLVDRELKSFGLTRRQIGLLMHIERAKSASAADLAPRLGVDSTAVKRMVDRLVEGGHLHRRRDPKDGRRHVIETTAEAREMMPKLKATSMRVEKRFLKGIDPDELETFQRVMLQMLENVGETTDPIAYD